MKCFVVFSVLMSVAFAYPSVLQTLPLSNLQSHASASATASLTPQRLSLLRLLPNAPIGPDGRDLDTLEVNLANVEQEATRQQVQAQLNSESIRDRLSLAPLLSASSSASASLASSPLTADGRILNNLEIRNAAAAAAAASAQRNQLRLTGQVSQAVQSQAEQNELSGAGPLLSATRLAQSLASLTPTGASSSSRVQLLESPQLSAIRAQQQQQLGSIANLRQDLLLTRDSRPLQANELPLLVRNDGQLVAAPLLVL